MLLFFRFAAARTARAWWKDSPPPYHEATTPIAATEWLAAHPDLPGPLFADYTFGSYLTFALPLAPVVDRQSLQRLSARALGKVSGDCICQARMGWTA